MRIFVSDKQQKMQKFSVAVMNETRLSMRNILRMHGSDAGTIT